VRRDEQTRSVADGGNELLYERQSIEDISAAAQKLGADETPRMRKLLDMRGKIA